MKAKSSFENWFRRQYGKLPSQRRLDAARRNRSSLEWELHQAEIACTVEDALFACFDNALKGWNAAKPQSQQRKEE